MTRRFLAPALAAGCLLSIAAPGRAADYVWNNPAGAWATASNCSPGGVPGLGDNATINAAGTYGIAVGSGQAANNVTLNAAGATATAAGDFTLGGTMTLSAGKWVMGGLGDGANTTALRGGTVTRGAGGTGTFGVYARLRAFDTQFQGAALYFTPGDGGQLRLAGSANFSPGSTVSFVNRDNIYQTGTGILYESSQTLNTTTVNLAPNVTFGATSGNTLTIGAGSLVQYTDPQGAGSAPVTVGRLFDEGTGGAAVNLVNRGTIRTSGGSTMVLGGYFAVGNSGSNVTLVNSGLIESRGGDLQLNLNNGFGPGASGFANQPGGVLRATQGGGVFVFAQNWTNAGTFEVMDGSTLDLGGTFTRAAIGTVVRSGTNAVGFYAARMDNSGGTFALSPATGNYALYGDGKGYAQIQGGAITASGGAKLLVRPHPGAGPDIYDYGGLIDVAVGPGVLDFSAPRAKLLVGGTTSFAPGDTLDLTGRSATLYFRGTRTFDNLTINLAGAGITGDAGGLYATNDLNEPGGSVVTLGPAALVRKTGAGLAFI